MQYDQTGQSGQKQKAVQGSYAQSFTQTICGQGKSCRKAIPGFVTGSRSGFCSTGVPVLDKGSALGLLSFLIHNQPAHTAAVSGTAGRQVTCTYVTVLDADESAKTHDRLNCC